MSNYRKGYAFERAVRLHLESKGYYCMRSAGSHGIADLIAKQPLNFPVFIQLKNGTKISNYEKTCLRDFGKEHKFCYVSIIQKINKKIIYEYLDNGNWKQNIYKNVKEIVLHDE